MPDDSTENEAIHDKKVVFVVSAFKIHYFIECIIFFSASDRGLREATGRTPARGVSEAAVTGPRKIVQDV